MTRNKKTTSTSAPTKPVTVAEKKEWYNENKNSIEKFAKVTDPLLLKDVTKTTQKRISTFDKETLISYFENIPSHEKDLRNLSRYIYYRSHVYRRIINFYANMFCLNARTIIPSYTPLKDNDPKRVLKNYYQTSQILENMSLQGEMVSPYTVCFLEDVFYGLVYYDDTGMFILRMDPDYCMINGKFMTGDFSYAVNMTGFRNKTYMIESLGEPLQSMYREYERTGQKWQSVPSEYCLCLKFNTDDWEIVTPAYMGLFNSLINLTDQEDIEAIANELSVYKLVWMELSTKGDTIDDWKVSPEAAIEYFDRISEAFPEYVGGGVVPGRLETIDFNKDAVSDTTTLAKATETVLNTAGGAEVLNGATISGTSAYKGAAIANTEFAISTLLPQTQAWVNRFLTYHMTSPCKVKFFPVSVYTKDDFQKNLLTAAQNGLPTKLAYNTLNGFSELDTLALNFFEEEVLDLGNRLKPLSTSYTQSSYDAGETDEIGQGRPALDDGELSDEGEASRDKRDRQ